MSELPMSELPALAVDRIIDRALAEDCGRGDLTSRLTIDPGARGVAHAVARQDVIVAGIGVFARVFERVDLDIRVALLVRDRDRAEAGRKLAEVQGCVAKILLAERVALNLLQRMCGIAATTRLFVEAAARCGGSRICDTRKTTPGLRLLERYAVRCGGGANHREDLSSGVLIKDNHVVACGGVRQAVQRAKAAAPHMLKIEVEVSSIDELREAIDAGADIVLLDNMDVGTMRTAVEVSGGRVLLEASGGVRLDNVAELAATGVDVISAGALTHSVRAADIALDLVSG